MVGGSYSWEGRVEIYLNGEWGTIREYGDYRISNVICRQLGYAFQCKFTRKIISDQINWIIYSDGVIIYCILLFLVDNNYYCDSNPVNDKPVHLYGLYCYGGEYSILDCHYEDQIPLYNADCIWSVKCENGKLPILACIQSAFKIEKEGIRNHTALAYIFWCRSV